MLHTGTMFAVIVYFWKAWKRAFFSSQSQIFQFAKQIIMVTAVTGVIAAGAVAHLAANRPTQLA